MRKILLVEDQNIIVKNIKLGLQKDYEVLSVNTYEKALEVDISDIDLMLLDISLPDGNGVDLYKYYLGIKKVPTIFLTAASEEASIVNAFSLGCEDYVTKPFKMGELKARIKRLLPSEIVFSNIRVDLDQQKVYLNEKLVKLSTREYELFLYFLNNKNRVLSREELFSIWEASDKYINDNTLSVYIKRLRTKLKLDNLKTIKNMGYILDEE